MLLSVTAAVVVIVLSSTSTLTLLVLASFAYALLTRRLGVIAVAYALFAAIWLMALGFMHLMGIVLPRFGYSDMSTLVAPFLRSLVLLNTLLAMALSSRIQGVMTALKTLRLPYWLYIPAAAMIRFIPAFIEDIKQISESLAIKGYRQTPFFLLRHPLSGLRLVFIPLLFRALRTSDELGMAAELKGVGYNRRVSYYRTNRFTWRDALIVGSSSIIVAAAISAEFRPALFF
jgi:energy-coupling factor transport system permease protein